MMKKGKTFMLAAVLILAFAQVAFPALTAVGPVLPDADGNPLAPPWSAGYNGFPLWYRDSLGQTATLSNPPSPLSVPDPVDPTNPFSVQVGWGAEAFYWSSEATTPMPAGDALLVLALEAAWAAEVPDPGDQMVFARVRIRIDIQNPGDYTVTHPYGQITYTNVPAGVRAINDTIDIGAVPGDFTGALAGQIGPFLRQVGAPDGAFGDGVTPAPVTGSPTNNNFFRVEGPDGTFETNLFVTTGEIFSGTPFNVTRATFTRDGAGNAVADIFANTPPPLVPRTNIRVRIPGQQPPVRLTRAELDYFGQITFTVPFNPLVRIIGGIGGTNRTTLPVTLVDVITVTAATYSLSTQTLSVTASSSDALATLTGSGWAGAGAGQPLNPGAVTDFVGIPIPPASVTVTSSSNGTGTGQVTIIP